MIVRDSSNIDVQVQSFYIPEQSNPAENKYVFAYRVKIKNNSKETAKLVSRHWIITDGDGKNSEVQGKGVIGEQPSIFPGEEYEYTSGAILKTPVGTMHGYYQMLTKNGQSFGASIKPFLLMKPNMLH